MIRTVSRIMSQSKASPGATTAAVEPATVDPATGAPTAGEPTPTETPPGTPPSEILDVEAIRELVPHRYPMLMIDRILSLDPGKRCQALKNVTANEPYFVGHYPERSVMPGVLIIEGMAQVAGIVVATADTEYAKRTLPLLGGVEKIRFKKQVVPGDQIIYEVETRAYRLRNWMMHCRAYVDAQIVAEGRVLAVQYPR